MSDDQKPRIRVTTAGDLSGIVRNGEVIRPGPKSTYMRGNKSPFFWNWNPALRDNREDVRDGYVEAASRTIDAMQNSGWLSGGVDQAIANTMGTGLRLAARPDKLALKWTDKQAQEWADIVERRWSTWSESPMECDAAGKQDVSQLCDSAMRFQFSYGEAFALMPYVSRPFSTPGTKIQMLPPSRLSQDSNRANRTFQGVTIDRYGMPTAYNVQTDADNLLSRTAIRARDGAGRPQVAHIFEGLSGTTRGISCFAPILHVMRQYDQLSDATLQGALIQAIHAATITGDAPTADMLAALQTPEEQAETELAGGTGFDALLEMMGGWYQNSKIDLGSSGKVVHLFPGQKLEFLKNQHDSGNYNPFVKWLLREVCRPLGLTFETFTGDYSGATYSSVRMAEANAWLLTQRRRRTGPGRLCQLIYEAWLEEEIESGRIPFPNGGFYAFLNQRAAASGAEWRGPARPQADDLKTAKAHQIYKSMGIMSSEFIAAEVGLDYGDEAERIAREMALREQLGLPEGDAMAPENDPADDAEEPAPPVDAPAGGQ